MGCLYPNSWRQGGGRNRIKLNLCFASCFKGVNVRAVVFCFSGSLKVYGYRFAGEVYAVAVFEWAVIQ